MPKIKTTFLSTCTIAKHLKTIEYKLKSRYEETFKEKRTNDATTAFYQHSALCGRPLYFATQLSK